MKKLKEVSERQKVRIEIARLDWIKILSEAIMSRPTSWGEDIVREWRNASDEIWGAMNREAVKAGIWEDFLTRKVPLPKSDIKGK